MNRPKLFFYYMKQGIIEGLNYLKMNYYWTFCNDIIKIEGKIIPLDDSIIIFKNDIYIYIYWDKRMIDFNLMEFHIEFRKRKWEYYQYMSVKSYYKEKYRFMKDEKLDKYKINEDTFNFFKYYILREIMRIEESYPEIFEKGILPFDTV